MNMEEPLDPAWSYTQAVARRKRERAERDRRAEAARSFMTRLNAVIQLVFCLGMSIITAIYFDENIEKVTNTTDLAVSVVSFLIAQICFWLYIILFPRYFSSLE